MNANEILTYMASKIAPDSFEDKCDYRHSTYVGWRFLCNLVTFLVGKSGF